MADYVKDTTVRVRVQDDTAKGAKQVEKSVQNMGKKVSTSMQGMLGEKAGRTMSQFNEKTEKGRQLLTAFGGTMGGVAGQAVYYGGTLSFVLGRFKLWELGVMSAVGAVVAFGYALTKQMNEPLETAKKNVDDLSEKVNTLIASLDKMNMKNVYALAGWDQWRIKTQELTGNLNRLELERARLLDYAEQLRKAAEKAFGRDVTLKEIIDRSDELGKKWNEVNQQIMNVKNSLEDMAKMKTIAALADVQKMMGGGPVSTEDIFKSWLPKAGGNKADKKKGGAKGWSAKSEIDASQRAMDNLEAALDAMDAILQAGRDRQDREAAMYAANEIDRAVARQNAYLEVVRNGEQAATDIYQENADRREQIWQNEIDFASQRADMILSVSQDFAESLQMVGLGIAKSEKTTMRIKAIYQAITDGLQAAHYIAEGIKSIYEEEYAKAAIAFSASTLFQISASMAAARAGGVGGLGSPSGGVGGGRGRGGRNRRSPPQTGERQPGMTVVINAPIGSRGMGEWVVDQFNQQTRRARPSAPRDEVGY